MKKLFFIYNPFSGKATIRAHLSDIVEIFAKAGYRTEIHPTQSRLDAKKRVMELADDYDLVVCSGGDGTLNEVVSGLMEAESITTLGYIPSGSTNDFATSINLPKEVKQATETAVNGEIHVVDVGKFNERYFVYVAAFGALAEVSYSTPQDMKNVLGHSAYIVEGVKRLTSMKARHMKVTYDEGEIEGDFMLGLITNSKSVGGFKGITGKDVDLSDGLFEVTLIRKLKSPIDIQQIVEYFTGTYSKKNDCIQNFKTSELRIEADDALEWVLDGEYGGCVKEAEIKNIHHALKIMAEKE
ncbi:MAG: YegS/Rv2252/BmrU family lipid kinase [Lachnospiraceae bacterium]|nr:YegS/Rv2252/BmrU family lipid kinase [Lachnospiraceae bacterium]